MHAAGCSQLGRLLVTIGGETALPMDWHTRYIQQAAWTRELREHLLDQAGIRRGGSLLEVGCGTGAILLEFGKSDDQARYPQIRVHGLDNQASNLSSAGQHAPRAILTRGDAHNLPYEDASFDLTCCHFLLLWLSDPLLAIREMRRVTRRAGHVLAFAEPDYSKRSDLPSSLAEIGRLQTRALKDQGADPSIGSRIAGLFDRAGLKIVEAGTIASRDRGAYDAAEANAEWLVLREDLSGRLSDSELDSLEQLDMRARQSGERILYVPTFFVHAQV